MKLNEQALSPIPSPCINVCRMEGQLCLGCYRTLDEISGWSQMSRVEKQQVLQAVLVRAVDPARAS